MTYSGSSDSTADPAASALARVRSAARTVRDTTRRSDPELSTARPDGRDPQTLAAAMDSWLRAEGHTASLAVGGLIGRWEEIVGERIAAHVSVSEYRPDPGGGGTAVLSADSQEWAVQIRYLVTELQRRITEEIGPGLVTRLEVRGPGGARGRGGWRVRSGRRSPRLTD